MDKVYDAIWFTALSFLSPEVLAKCATLSKSISRVVRDDSLWATFLTKLWTGKVYIPTQFLELRKQKQSYLAYGRSITDASRVNIRPEEVVEFVWNFRFKESAGHVWTAADPWWLGGPAQQRRFFSNGTVTAHGRESRPLATEQKWKIIQLGENTQIKIFGFPSYTVYRHSNWGFRLESCWVLWTSFPMPLRGQDAALETALTSFTEDQRRQVAEYSTTVRGS